MTDDPTPDPDGRLHLPACLAAGAPDGYAAYGLADYYGEVIAMVRLRFSDDSWRAFPYHALAALDYDPSLGVELTFPTTRVCVRGRRLFPLFTHLADHAVKWVWEADRTQALHAPASATVVERIEVGAGMGF